jgi:hypothetical protein
MIQKARNKFLNEKEFQNNKYELNGRDPNGFAGFA